MELKLFDGADSENELDFKIDNAFANNYDKWRRKEELHKLQTKYGPNAALPNMDSESSDSESDEDEVHVSEKFEKDFLKTLSLLKNKDPRIYDSSFNCFSEDVQTLIPNENKILKHKPVTIRDYERQIILKKDKLDDEDLTHGDPVEESQPYVEEQRQLKENLKTFLKDNGSDESDNENVAGLFRKREKTQKEKEEEEKDYREWLKGQSDHLNDAKEEDDLNALKQFWSQPNLDEKDAFLRDYILDRRYLNTADDKYIPSYDEIIHDSDGNLSEDETTIHQQVTFERKYNFRFEEPDPEFIKKYPRTVKSTMRQQSNKRAQKRKEIKDRKAEEKQKKFEEIGRLKALKLKEIQEKISKLKEITGNEELAFQEEDIMNDFDPDSHDKRMKELFNDEYYEEPDEQKPEFPDLDDELEIENWDKYEEEAQQLNNYEKDYEAHCEDDDFNMDADYDPVKKKDTLILDGDGTKRRKRKRKSKLAEILASEKPKFDPLNSDKTYSDYMDEYYRIDCEDIIGDLPCRFKYVETVPNDYGLTIEEILLADDKELNQWYSLKKSLKNKPEYQERGEVKAYKKRAENIKLKRKYLPSLFRNIPEDPEDQPDITAVNNRPGAKKKKKKRKNKKNAANVDLQIGTISGKSESINDDMPEHKSKTTNGMTNDGNKKQKTKKKKLEIITLASVANVPDKEFGKPDSAEDQRKKNKKRTFLHGESNGPSGAGMMAKKRKKNKQNGGFRSGTVKNQTNDPLHSLTDERLKAYGLNPKKYKNFLRFKKY